ncbi:MAG: hypothetical protein AAF614_43860 [Chloroflexota bacterium]
MSFSIANHLSSHRKPNKRLETRIRHAAEKMNQVPGYTHYRILPPLAKEDHYVVLTFWHKPSFGRKHNHILEKYLRRLDTGRK